MLPKEDPIEPTGEQRDAIELIATGDSVAIEAGAGTGKTSTLVMAAESNRRRSSYVAFNKAIVVDSSKKFPKWVKCSTAHSLAMGAVGRPFAPRLGSPRMLSPQIARLLDIDPITIPAPGGPKRLAAGYLAGLAMTGVRVFCQSADDEISGSHVPYVEGIDARSGDGRRGWANNDQIRAALVEPMRRAWADLCDPAGKLPYRHEHYLKLWQIVGPVIPSDVVYCDEAQDLSPVLLAIIAAQADSQRVYVGDSQQAIYGFMGAKNALASVPTDLRAYLTKSFRFGPEIAEVANVILGRLGAEIRLSGSDVIESSVGPLPVGYDAVLCRTNAKAVAWTLEAMRSGVAVHLVGGGAEVRRFAEGALALMESRSTTCPDLACFSTWGEAQFYVSDDPQGSELKLMVDLCDEFGPETILAALKRMTPERSASLVVSTAHKAKGREWGTVKLAADFVAGSTSPEGAPLEELRLMYVAATRARWRLDATEAPAFGELGMDLGGDRV